MGRCIAWSVYPIALASSRPLPGTASLYIPAFPRAHCPPAHTCMQPNLPTSSPPDAVTVPAACVTPPSTLRQQLAVSQPATNAALLRQFLLARPRSGFHLPCRHPADPIAPRAGNRSRCWGYTPLLPSSTPARRATVVEQALLRSLAQTDRPSILCPFPSLALFPTPPRTAIRFNS